MERSPMSLWPVLMDPTGSPRSRPCMQDELKLVDPNTEKATGDHRIFWTG